MARLERVRETVSAPVTLDYLSQRARAGWRLSALEWVREVEGEVDQGAAPVEDVPFGLRVAGDCSHLEQDPAEMEALTRMMEGISQDLPLGRIAQELNAVGLRTRGGSPWTQQAVFTMLPRLIEVGPRILTSPGWPERRRRGRAGGRGNASPPQGDV